MASVVAEVVRFVHQHQQWVFMQEKLLLLAATADAAELTELASIVAREKNEFVCEVVQQSEPHSIIVHNLLDWTSYSTKNRLHQTCILEE